MVTCKKYVARDGHPSEVPMCIGLSSLFSRPLYNASNLDLKDWSMISWVGLSALCVTHNLKGEGQACFDSKIDQQVRQLGFVINLDMLKHRYER